MNAHKSVFANSLREYCRMTLIFFIKRGKRYRNRTFLNIGITNSRFKKIISNIPINTKPMKIIPRKTYLSICHSTIKKYAKPKKPNAINTICCAQLPTKVEKTPFMAFLGFKNNNRPPKSPTRLGINKEEVTPAKTALKAFQNEISSLCLMRGNHFRVSAAQLRGNKMSVKTSHAECLPLSSKRKSAFISSKFSLLNTSYHKRRAKRTKTPLLMSQLM